MLLIFRLFIVGKSLISWQYCLELWWDFTGHSIVFRGLEECRFILHSTTWSWVRRFQMRISNACLNWIDSNWYNLRCIWLFWLLFLLYLMYSFVSYSFLFFALLLFVLVSIAFSVRRSSVLLDLWHDVVFIHDLISISGLPRFVRRFLLIKQFDLCRSCSAYPAIGFQYDCLLISLIALFILLCFFSEWFCFCMFLKACLCLISLCWYLPTFL